MRASSPARSSKGSRKFPGRRDGPDAALPHHRRPAAGGGAQQDLGVLAQHLSLGFEDGVKILSYLLTTNAVTVVLFQLLASRISQKLEPVRSIVLGGLLMFAGMAGFGLSGEAWQFIVAMVVFSIGETFIIPAEFAIIDRIAPEDRRGSYFGAQTIAQLGGFVGPSPAA
ncbi:MFS transporter [Streptomyces cirratus]